MGQFHFDPSAYRELMVSEVPHYDRLQDAVRDAAAGVEPVKRILDLGTGTGVTADRVLGIYPRAQVVGIDESAGMLAHARTVLPAATVLRTADLRDSLPEGPFDLVVSALAVHHLDSAGKADLFARVAQRLRPCGRFVLGDVVVPDDPADVVTPIDGDYDRPDTVADQLRWLSEAGFSAEIAWAEKDLAILVGNLAG